MADKKLFDTLSIRGIPIKNRICVPPMVSDWVIREGEITPGHVAHYKAIAGGGPGLVIVEAACVTEDGRLHTGQIGIWDDKFISGLADIAAAVHSGDCPAFLQIHHAGALAFGDKKLSPSVYYPKEGVQAREIKLSEIHEIQADFVRAGVRAYRAGFDGVELHGCHQYLIPQFLNSDVNHRSDIYGRQPELFVTEIVDNLREQVPEEFVIGIRMGAFEPKLEDGLRHARVFEQHGIDFLDISYGCVGESQPVPYNLTEVPKGFPFKDVVYAAGEFKKQSNVPVFAVKEIRTPQDAQKVLELTDVDMVDIGRSTLVDPNWANKAKRGEETGVCLGCKICQWRVDVSRCPGRIKLKNSEKS